MSRRLAILRAQLAARPLWETVQGNPLVQRNRDTGTLRAIGLTLPEKETPLTRQWQTTPEEKTAVLQQTGWIPFTCTEKSICPVSPETLVWVLLDGRPVGDGQRKQASYWFWKLPSRITAYSLDEKQPPLVQQTYGETLFHKITEAWMPITPEAAKELCRLPEWQKKALKLECASPENPTDYQESCGLKYAGVGIRITLLYRVRLAFDDLPF